MFSKKEDSEKIFKEGYEIYLKEKQSNALTSSLKFIPYFKKAAKKKNWKARFMLGYLLVIPYKDIEVNIEKGNKILSKCFKPLKAMVDENYDPLACEFLAKYYEIPLCNFVKDDLKVKKLLESAKQSSSLDINLQEMNYNEKKYLEKESEDETFSELVYAIKTLQEPSNEDKQDLLKIVNQFAKNDDIRALLFLGDCYLEGKFVEKDDNQALAYYLKAEKLGSVRATCNLGILYLTTSTSKANITLGLNKIYQAAKKGLKEALFELGKIYYEGIYLEKDINKAYIYFQASYSRQHKQAKEYLLKIESENNESLSIEGMKKYLNPDNEDLEDEDYKKIINTLNKGIR